MKSITLRTLLREPVKVKRMTRAGVSVRVTDRGAPLWLIQPDGIDPDEQARIQATDEILDEVLREKPSKISAIKLLLESRR